jgi:L-lactate dehydrogenase complex protein LldG
MSSRDKILSAVKRNQPGRESLPDLQQLTPIHFDNVVEQFIKVLEAIGGSIIKIHSLTDITAYLKEHYKEGHRLVTTIDGIEGLHKIDPFVDPHEFETVELAVLPVLFAVAENGAVWLTENEMQVRVLPFICQQLAVVLSANTIVKHMHEAYAKIADENYGFGVFIAGPSKTADIEQSLVLGAHGPAGMTVFLLS